MKVLVIVKATAASEAGEMPSMELLAAMGAFNEELARAGVLVDAAGLKPSSLGVRVRFSGVDRLVIDGPFTETKELIAGFWIWKVGSLQEAIDWVKKCPNPMPEDSDIEIRPLYEHEDFGELMTPELVDDFASTYAIAMGLPAPRFEEAGPLRIAGINASYTMETRKQIPGQWEAFVPQATAINTHPAATYYGVIGNTTSECGFDYLAGVEVPEGTTAPAHFTSITIDPRRYAVFPHDQHVSTLPQAIDTIWSKWVPESGLKVATAPWFERYTSEFNPQTGLGGMELWIPLES